MTGHSLTPSHSHARPGLAGRLVNRFRGHNDTPDPFPEYSRADVLARLNAVAAQNTAEAHDDDPASRVGERIDLAGHFGPPRLTGQAPHDVAELLAATASWGPWDAPDGLLLDGQDLTDGRVAPAYVPEHAAERRVLDIYDDLRDLPALRDAIRATMQRGCTECGTCGRSLPGAGWPERFAAQLAHIGSGEDAPSSDGSRIAADAGTGTAVAA